MKQPKPHQSWKIGLSLFFVLAFSCNVFAQTKVLDSLLKQIAQHTQKDTIRVGYLVNAAWNMTHTNPKDAFKYVDEAIEISNQLKWPRGSISAWRQKGNLYYVMADNLSAMDAFQEGLKIAQTSNHKILEASLYGNIGNIHADLKQNQKALENYFLYLKTARDLEQKPDEARALSNIGLVYGDMGNQDKGIVYLDSALVLAKEEKNTYFIAGIINNVGIMYKDKKDYSTSLEYYQQAAELANESQIKYIEASALNSQGKVNLALGNLSEAKSKAEEGLAMSKEINAVEWQADSWELLSTVNEQQGNMAEALTAYKNHIQLRDSILNEEKKAELTKKEMQFQLEKQQAEADEAISRQRLIKNGAVTGGIILLLISIIGYVLYKRRRDALDQKKLAEFHAKVAETELKALRSQMNPHFIFNALNSISDYVVRNDVEMANTYLLKFAKLTRAILENSEKKWITLEEDLELIELYIQIESLRLQNKLNHSIKVDKSIDAQNTLVPPLMLQPFIENSIWHGIANREHPCEIDIQIKKEMDMVVCIVDDNGAGRRKTLDIQSEKSSMGLKITKNRLDIISELKKVKGSIEMFDKERGLRVELKLPLELRF